MYKMLIITGPSGSGKPTVINYLLKKPLFTLSVSYTTRPSRPTQTDGKEYFFTTREDFETKIKDGFFIEYTEFNGNYYGTPATSLEADNILILDIELDGLKFFKDKFPRFFFCLVYIEKEVLEKRLLQRMNENSQTNEEEFEGRMDTYDSFIEIKDSFDFNMTINNSKSIEHLLKQADDLADRVIQYYSMENKQ